MGEFTFFRKLHLTAGVRMEDATTEVQTTIGADRVDSLVSVKKADWLPAATLVYNITDNINECTLAVSSRAVKEECALLGC